MRDTTNVIKKYPRNQFFVFPLTCFVSSSSMLYFWLATTTPSAPSQWLTHSEAFASNNIIQTRGTPPKAVDGRLLIVVSKE